jgi:multiple sugar transport system permease protein
MNRSARLSRLLLALPAYGLIALLVGVPAVGSLYLSFHKWKLASFQNGVPFVGTDNYTAALGDPAFLHSIWLTLGFTLAALVVELVLGTLLALLLDRELRGGGTMRAMALLPMFVTNVVIGLIFRILLSYDFGVVNWFSSLFGLGPVPWLGDPKLAFWTLVLVDAWNTTSFVALLVLAGLRALPREPLEAAEVDGAGAFARFRYVIFPLLQPVIGVAALWRTIDLFRIFDVVFSLTGGGPSDATETASVFVYRHALGPLNLGLASAMSFIILFVLVLLLGTEAYLLRRRT